MNLVSVFYYKISKKSACLIMHLTLLDKKNVSRLLNFSSFVNVSEVQNSVIV